MLKYAFFSFTVIFFFSVTSKAQVEDIRFEQLKVENGLSSHMIFNIYQDVNGFMWFNDQRYDGRSLKSYQVGIYEIKVGELLKLMVPPILLSVPLWNSVSEGSRDSTVRSTRGVISNTISVLLRSSR